jgi:hypothetical protein
LDELFFSIDFVLDVGLVFSVEVVVLVLGLRLDLVVWQFDLGFEDLGVFDDLDWFWFLRAGLWFWGTRAEILFAEMFNLLFAGLSLLEVLLAFDSEDLLVFDIVLTFGAVSGESVFLFGFGLVLICWQLHGKDLIQAIITKSNKSIHNDAFPWTIFLINCNFFPTNQSPHPNLDIEVTLKSKFVFIDFLIFWAVIRILLFVLFVFGLVFFFGFFFGGLWFGFEREVLVFGGFGFSQHVLIFVSGVFIDIGLLHRCVNVVDLLLSFFKRIFQLVDFFFGDPLFALPDGTGQV